MIRKLKAQIFPKGIRRFLKGINNPIFYRVGKSKLLQDLRALGIGRGDLICIHSSMSGSGYIIGGADSFISTFQQLVGNEGTVMMPTFTGGTSTLNYIKTNPPPFDSFVTPCTTGIINEVFRKTPGVVRSYHPTHSIAAWGKIANYLVKDHHLSETPFGERTPYSKLIQDRGKVVLLNVNANSMIHRLQEIVDWPGHYLKEVFTLKVKIEKRLLDVVTKVHAPNSGLITLIGEEPNSSFKFVFPDYALPFCLSEKTRADFKKISKSLKSDLDKRLKFFLSSGVVKFGQVGYGQAAVIEAYDFSKKICKDLKIYIDRQKEYGL